MRTAEEARKRAVEKHRAYVTYDFDDYSWGIARRIPENRYKLKHGIEFYEVATDSAEDMEDYLDDYCRRKMDC